MLLNVDRPHYVSLARARREIQSGWLLQVRGTSYISRVIAASTGGIHSHSALLERTQYGIDVLEIVEFAGGRSVPLREYVMHRSQAVDVFSVDLHRWPEYDGAAAAAHMHSLIGRTKYNYGQIGWMLLRKLPIIWRMRLLKTPTDDELSIGNVAAHCSHAVAESCRLAGVDPVPRLPDFFVDPNHLTRSLLFDYWGTLEFE
jgi:hypothetical protein